MSLPRRFLPLVPHFFATLSLAWPCLVRADSADYSFAVLEPGTASATSVLEEKGRAKSAYAAVNAFDGKTDTAWCEGQPDAGQGSVVKATFKPRLAHGVVILNGFGKRRSLYLSNNRVKEYKLTVVDHQGNAHVLTGTLKDDTCAYPTAGGKMTAEESCEEQVPPAEVAKCVGELKNQCIMDGYEGGGERIAFAKPLCLRSVELEIVSVYAGKKHNDTCVAELQLFEDLYPGNNLAEELKGVCK